MDTVLLKLPEGESLLAEAKAIGDEVAQRRTATTEDSGQLTVLAGLIRANVDATARGMGSAFRNSRAAGLKPSLEQPLDEFTTAAGAFLETVDREFISKTSTDVEPLNHQVAGIKALDASFGLWDRTVVELDQLLQARMDRLYQRERLIEGVSLITVTLA